MIEKKSYVSDATTNLIETVDSLIVDAETCIKADSLFQEEESLYDAGEYSAAIVKLQEAQDLFLSISAEMSVECDMLITECKQSEAEALLNDGIAYYNLQQYDLAGSVFEKALTLFTELQNTKIEECEEWMASCRQDLQILPTSDHFAFVFYVVPVAAALAIIGAVIWKKNRREPLDDDTQAFDDKTQIY
jgi:tetratricopeptide (TPR) repeat protein